MRVVAWIVLCGICIHASAQSTDDLLSVYAAARANNAALRQAAAQAGGADAGADVSRAALLPQWTLTATPLRAEGVTATTSASQVTQTLFNLAALSNWHAARNDADAQTANLRAAEQVLLADVATRYFAVLTAQNQLATLAANEAAFAELVRQSEVRVQERLSAPVDVDQAKAFFGLAQGTTQDAREALADARQAVQQLTGIAPLPLRSLRQDLRAAPPQPASPAAWVGEALAGHPLLQAGSASVAAAQDRIDAARGAYLPTLDLSVTSARAAPDGPPGAGQTTSTSIGIQLTVPLFTGGATSALRRQATYVRDGQVAQLEAIRRQIVRNVELEWQAAQGSALQIGTASAAALAAEHALAATRAGQQNGTRTLTDVLNAIQTNGQAQLQLIQARNRHVVALLLLKQAAGRLTIDDLGGVNALLEADHSPVPVSDGKAAARSADPE